MKNTLILLVCFLFAGISLGEEYAPAVEKFKLCEDEVRATFFWVDTTSGQTWWMDPDEREWVDHGKPPSARTAPVGTYIPQKDNRSPGIFILNTATGAAWWTDGEQWKTIGEPGK